MITIKESPLTHDEIIFIKNRFLCLEKDLSKKADDELKDSSHNFDLWIQENNFVTFKPFNNDIKIGYAIVGNINKDNCFLFDLYIDPHFRKIGAARNIINYLKLKYGKIKFLIYPNDTLALTFWEKLGAKHDHQNQSWEL
jgi:GNAT superfamily N-acetyltransferase